MTSWFLFYDHQNLGDLFFKAGFEFPYFVGVQNPKNNIYFARSTIWFLAYTLTGVQLKGTTLALFISSYKLCSAQAGLPMKKRNSGNKVIDTYHIPPVHISLENCKCGLALHQEGKCFFARGSCDCSIPHLQRCWLPFELLVSSHMPREACEKVMCTVRLCLQNSLNWTV